MSLVKINMHEPEKFVQKGEGVGVIIIQSSVADDASCNRHQKTE